MILLILKKSRKYFQEKVRIDKRNNQDAAYQIQAYNNSLVDDYIRSFTDDDLTLKLPATSLLVAELSILNKPQVYQNYQRIINSPYTDNDALFQMIIRNKADKDLNRIVEAELERIVKNLDYIEAVMQKYDIEYSEYKKLVDKQKNSSVANRQKILQQVAYKSEQLLVNEGLNIPPHVATYRDVDLTAENLFRQSQMMSKYDEITSINEHYLNEGKSVVYTGKEWVWTGAGLTTRHESTHLQKRKLDETFLVVNDRTLDVDEMMHPCDPNGSFSNAWICYCECEYLTNY